MLAIAPAADAPKYRAEAAWFLGHANEAGARRPDLAVSRFEDCGPLVWLDVAYPLTCPLRSPVSLWPGGRSAGRTGR